MSGNSTVTMTVSVTATASPSPTNTDNNNNNNNGTTSNSLYLFTFLTTLLLLLAVSCGIVLRSFILRRRFRRRVEAAIAAGVLLPEQVEAMRRRGPTVGERPSMWEVRIENANLKGGKDGFEPGTSGSHFDKALDFDNWENVMPVSAAIVPASKKAAEAGTSTAAGANAAPTSSDEQPAVSSTSPTSSGRRSIFSRLTRNRDASSGSILPLTALPPPPTPSSQPTPSSPYSPDSPNNSGERTPDPERLDKLQLTVLIAMPNANSRQYIPPSEQTSSGSEDQAAADDDEEEEIPEVVFGLTEVLWDGGLDWKPGESISVKDKLKKMESPSRRNSSDDGDGDDERHEQHDSTS